jgi:membrane protease YdiL (CAAX protease family)
MTEGKGVTAMEEAAVKAPKNHLAVTVTYVVFLYIAWTGAWLLSMALEDRLLLPATPLVRFLYWTAMRGLLWFLPAALLIRRSGKSLKGVLNLGSLKRILLWGGGLGLLLAAEITVTKLVRGAPVFSWDMSWSLLTAAVIAPFVEELLFRGAVLGAFQTKLKFWPANILTGVLFLLVHFPGWYFQGVLMKNLLSPAGGALAILLLGLIFGLAARQSKSVSGSILTHMLNNFFSAM